MGRSFDMWLLNQFNKEAKDPNGIYAMADGQLIDVSAVGDPMFANKLLGDSVAFRYEGDTATICSPCEGTLSVLFPTGHAFGITRKDGVEVLVHIGINTVEAKGKGFNILHKKQGQNVKAGDPIVEVDLAELRKTYEMNTMLIITNANGKSFTFRQPGFAKCGESVLAQK
ncbi:MAG: PTS glucose transporter subunit IIA [Solobacterium sp.]|jgi:PTS system glucose-specific IIA component|nr:PTS glucose transporter subunit IIA [Solobacterium sp.]MCH4227383.1 PTS glucose transporter subunit IIA [Solobacterium sp.]